MRYLEPAMQWFGKSCTLKIIDEGDSLRVDTVRQKRLIDIIFHAAGFLLCLAVYLSSHAYWWLLYAGLVAILGVNYLIDRPVSSMQVTEQSISVLNKSRWRSTRIHLAWREIEKLEYNSIPEGESGLCARTGWLTYKYLLCEIDEEQANCIIAAIYKKLSMPELPDEQAEQDKKLFTTLDLSTR